MLFIPPHNKFESYVVFVAGAYSYDNGNAPYVEPQISKGYMQSFKTLVYPNKPYYYYMEMDDSGLTSFSLFAVADVNNSTSRTLLETLHVQHETVCADNYFKGTVLGLYFGGTCVAPVEIVAEYIS